MPRTRNSPNPRQKPSFFSLVNRWLQGGSDPYLFLFQSSIGSQFQPDEISSVMAADRTFFRHFCASVNMTALQTHPGSFYIRNKKFLLLQKVEPPHTLEEVSLATKLCFARAFRERLPIFFQSGAIVPLKNIIGGRCTAASHAFLPIEKKCPGQEILELAPGKGVCAYHIGDYLSIGQAYERILAYCDREGLQIISDSYEFAVNDYLSTGLEDEYITKIIFYVQDDK